MVFVINFSPKKYPTEKYLRFFASGYLKKYRYKTNLQHQFVKAFNPFSDTLILVVVSTYPARHQEIQEAQRTAAHTAPIEDPQLQLALVVAPEVRLGKSRKIHSD